MFTIFFVWMAWLSTPPLNCPLYQEYMAKIQATPNKEYKLKLAYAELALAAAKDCGDPKLIESATIHVQSWYHLGLAVEAARQAHVEVNLED